LKTQTEGWNFQSKTTSKRKNICKFFLHTELPTNLLATKSLATG